MQSTSPMRCPCMVPPNSWHGGAINYFSYQCIMPYAWSSPPYHPRNSLYLLVCLRTRAYQIVMSSTKMMLAWSETIRIIVNLVLEAALTGFACIKASILALPSAILHTMRLTCAILREPALKQILSTFGRSLMVYVIYLNDEHKDRSSQAYIRLRWSL